MRYFAIILSIYLLFLSCIPCGDQKECNEGADIVAAASTANTPHKHATEACTPFCICSCCPASAFFQHLVIFKLFTPVIQQNKVDLKISFISKDFHSIWQPPKIG